jgi:hypothetical protein
LSFGMPSRSWFFLNVGVPYKLTQTELIDALREQVEFMKRSSWAFDRGFEDEAKRLAVVLRVLLHDTGASRSVLGQLNVKQNLRFLNTADPIDPFNLMPTWGLVHLTFGISPDGTPNARYEPRRNDPVDVGEPPPDLADKLQARPIYVPELPFDRWWQEPVTRDAHGNLFSRRDYVLTLSNQDGGAHVDPALNDAWAALTRDNSLGWIAVGPAGSAPLGTPAFASVRQIAYEVARTLQSQLSHLL